MTSGEELANRLRSLVEKLDLDREARGRHASEIAEVASTARGREPDKGEVARIALGLERYYSALESSREAVCRAFGTTPATGPDWHRTLLETVSRPDGARGAVMRPEVATRLLELLRFRHFLRHAYAVDLDWSRMHHLADDLPGLDASVESGVLEFREFVERCLVDIDLTDEG